MKFPMRVSTKEYLPVYGNGIDVYRWKMLCIVYDNEALGFIERLLKGHDIEHKTESVEPGES